jgi:secreted trypsin-like serine protease
MLRLPNKPRYRMEYWLSLASIAFCCLMGTDARGQQPAAARRFGEKVIHGTPADAGNWPGIAALRLHDPTTRQTLYFCGGTAIAPAWVLTAAHCVINLDALRQSFFPTAPHSFKLQVVIGSDNLEAVADKDIFDADEASLQIHDAYRSAISEARRSKNDEAELYAQDDIALIKLKLAYAGPLSALAATKAVEEPGTFNELLVAGFGATHPSGTDLKQFTRKDTGEVLQVSTARLLEAPLALVPRQECAKMFPSARVSDRQICAGAASAAKRTDSCSGDSGGPLVAITKPERFIVQIGIVSYGPLPCASAASPTGVYTRVSAYRDWILDTMRLSQAGSQSKAK